MTEVVEAASVELVPAPPSARPALVKPADLDESVANQHAYLALCEALLDASDYQKIRDGSYKKKSAWRKLNVAFNVSTKLVDEDETRDEQGRLIRARVTARAVAPNGREVDGLGVCDVKERCGDQCVPACEGFKHFSHPEHDLIATAHTRATNRAVSDLYGMGEVSAEEIDGRRETGVNVGQLLDRWLTPEVRSGLKAWREAMRYPVASRMTLSQAGEALVEVGRILERQQPTPAADPTPPDDELAAGREDTA